MIATTPEAAVAAAPRTPRATTPGTTGKITKEKSSTR